METIIRKLISKANAPRPEDSYNQAEVADRTVYVSGCLGIDKTTNKLVAGGIVEQTTLALENLKNVLEAANSGLDKVVTTTVFMKDLEHFDLMNEVYKNVFSHDCPARSAFQLVHLPMDALVVIQCTALTGDVKTVSS